MKKEEVEINKNNAKQIQQTFEQNGWELESVRLTRNRMVAIFVKQDGKE